MNSINPHETHVQTSSFKLSPSYPLDEHPSKEPSSLVFFAERGKERASVTFPRLYVLRLFRRWLASYVFYADNKWNVGLGAGFRRSASRKGSAVSTRGRGKAKEAKDTRGQRRESERGRERERGEILARCHARYKGLLSRAWSYCVCSGEVPKAGAPALMLPSLPPTL